MDDWQDKKTHTYAVIGVKNTNNNGARITRFKDEDESYSETKQNKINGTGR